MAGPLTSAQADVVASCTPPTRPFAITSPDALAQSITITSRSDITGIRVWLAAAGGTDVAVSIRTPNADGSPSATVIAAGLVHVTDTTPVSETLTLPRPVRLVAGRYLLVVDPPSGAALAWAGCAPPPSAWFRNDAGDWVALPATALAFAVDGGAPDLTPPVTTITQAPPSLGNEQSVAIGFSANKESTFTCAVDASTPTPCTSPLVLATVSEGQHTVTVTATDFLGNVDPHPPAVTFTIDRTPPLIGVGVAAPHAGSHTASVSITSNEPATLSCVLDGQPAVTCTSPWTVSIASEGPHSVQITGTDQAGNTAAAVTANFTADWTPPQLSIPSPISLDTTNAAGTPVSYAGTATDNLDPAPSVQCLPASGSVFPVGLTTVSCSATDASGNTATANFGVTVTLTGPAITAAEVDVAFDPTARALVFTEPDGGTTSVNGPTVTATMATHHTVATLWQHEASASIVSLAYDAAATRRTNHNGYAVHVQRRRHGEVRSIWLAAWASDRAVIVRYFPQLDISVVVTRREETRIDIRRVHGLVIPHLRTSGGTVYVVGVA